MFGITAFNLSGTESGPEKVSVPTVSYSVTVKETVCTSTTTTAICSFVTINGLFDNERVLNCIHVVQLLPCEKFYFY